MRISVITARPDHPLLTAMAGKLPDGHSIEWVDPETHGHGSAQEGVLNSPLADIYLLKARTHQALALAESLEDRGATVVNSAAATRLCQDRTAMAALAHSADIPFPRTTTATTLSQLAAETDLAYPLVVKSRHSRRHDLIARINSARELQSLTATWAQEPVVMQPFTPNSGWDLKLWVIADRVFAALRRSELVSSDRGRTTSLSLSDLPQDRIDLARKIGAVFALDIYGVDIVETADATPLIVDINAFPGIRDQKGAPQALASLVLRAAQDD